MRIPTINIPVRYLRRFHAAMTIAWIGLLLPTVIWWRESVPWLAIMSVWANVAAHFSSWQGARAEDAAGN